VSHSCQTCGEAGGMAACSRRRSRRDDSFFLKAKSEGMSRHSLLQRILAYPLLEIEEFWSRDES
jgi:hypothetical protein